MVKANKVYLPDEIGVTTISNQADQPGKKDDATGRRHTQRAVALRDMELTVEEAKELQERIEHPAAFPKRPPRDLPPGDDSRLH